MEDKLQVTSETTLMQNIAPTTLTFAKLVIKYIYRITI